MAIMIFALFIIFPFLLGFCHTRMSKQVPAILIYYRYFMSFNMVLAAVFVAFRMLLDGPGEAQLASWEFSPMFYLYGVALISMALMGAFTLFSRQSILKAPAILWAIFLALSTAVNALELLQGMIELNMIFIVHMAYNLITVGIILIFLWLLRGHRVSELFS